MLFKHLAVADTGWEMSQATAFPISAPWVKGTFFVWRRGKALCFSFLWPPCLNCGGANLGKEEIRTFHFKRRNTVFLETLLRSLFQILRGKLNEFIELVVRWYQAESWQSLTKKGSKVDESELCSPELLPELITTGNDGNILCDCLHDVERGMGVYAKVVFSTQPH